MSELDKDADERKFQARIDQWKAKLDTLRAQASETQTDAQIKTQDMVEEVEKTCSDYTQALDRFRAAGSEAWQDVADGCESAWEKFKASFDAARDRLG